MKTKITVALPSPLSSAEYNNKTTTKIVAVIMQAFVTSLNA